MMEADNQAKPHYGVVNFEKRQFPRFSLNLPIEYSRVDSTAGQSAQTENISQGGLLIHLPEKVAVGQILKLKLFFASVSESLRTMEVRVEVVWTSPEPGKIKGSCPSGVRFVDVNPQDMENLKNFLSSLSSR